MSSRPAPKPTARLAPEVNRILFVRNLPLKITPEELFETFGKFGALRQVRVGSSPETKGQAFVVYEDIYDAKAACEHLSGFSVGGRYLVVHYYAPPKGTRSAAVDPLAVQAEVELLRARVAAGEAAAAATSAGWVVGGGAGAGAGGDDDGPLDDEGDRRRAAASRAARAS